MRLSTLIGFEGIEDIERLRIETHGKPCGRSGYTIFDFGGSSNNVYALFGRTPSMRSGSVNNRFELPQLASALPVAIWWVRISGESTTRKADKVPLLSFTA